MFSFFSNKKSHNCAPDSCLKDTASMLDNRLQDITDELDDILDNWIDGMRGVHEELNDALDETNLILSQDTLHDEQKNALKNSKYILNSMKKSLKNYSGSVINKIENYKVKLQEFSDEIDWN